MIDSVVPRWVASAWVAGDRSPADAPLTAVEQTSLGRTSPGFERQFAAGRTCARRALAKLGLSVRDIPRGQDREPCWPPGVVGSITHTNDYVAAAVAHAGAARSIGIDVERSVPLTPAVERKVCLPSELRWPHGHAGHDGGGLSKVIFSAKESLYKAWYPLTKAWLGFHDAEIVLDIESGTFEARLLVDHDGFGETHVQGRWVRSDSHVATAIVLEPRSGR